MDDVNQRVALRTEGWYHGDVVDEILDERLGDTCIDTIHGHVVTVVGSPAQCQL